MILIEVIGEAQKQTFTLFFLYISLYHLISAPPQSTSLQKEWNEETQKHK